MRTMFASARVDCGRGSPESVLLNAMDSRQMTRDELRAFWLERDPERSLLKLSEFIKIDMRLRIDNDEIPKAEDYFDVFPELKTNKDRVVSLVYEEFCLHEEKGLPAVPSQFCARYAAWSDSLASQLGYHHCLSRAATSMKPPRFPEAGESFQCFKLRSILGQGGAARVFLALDGELGNREVALKISNDQGKEPSILGRLNHENIMPVLSVTRDQTLGLRGLCMPYRPGRPLNDVIRRLADKNKRPERASDLVRALFESPAQAAAGMQNGVRRLDFPAHGSYAEAAAWVIMVLARALDHAHALGILHRDVKPANVLFAVNEGPLLLDFNLAHEPHDGDRAAAAHRGGTLPYMAPEQIRAFIDPTLWDSVDKRADIYSLGLVLRELILLEPPYAPGGELSLPQAMADCLDHRSKPAGSLRKQHRSISHALDAIHQKCTALEPDDRYQTARDLAQDLAAFLAQKNLVHAKNPSAIESASYLLKRRRHILFVALAAGVLSPLLASPSVRHRLFPERGRGREVVAAIRERNWSLAKRLQDAQSGDLKPEAQSLVLRGIVALHNGDAQEARNRFREASGVPNELEAFRLGAELSGNEPMVRTELAWALMRAGEVEQALTIFRSDKGSPSEAQTTFRLLLDTRVESDIEGWDGLLMGIAWNRTGKNREQAELYFNKAITKLDSLHTFTLAGKIFPEISAVWNAIGNLHLLTKPEADLESASKAFETSLALDRDNPGALHGIFRCLYMQKQTVESLALIERTVHAMRARGLARPKIAVAMRDRIVARQRRAEELQNALAQDPTHAGKAATAEECRRFAVENLRELNDLIQDEPDPFRLRLLEVKALQGLGDAYSIEDHYPESCAQYDRAYASLQAIQAATPVRANESEEFKKLGFELELRRSKDGMILELERIDSDPAAAETHVKGARERCERLRRIQPNDADLPALERRLDAAKSRLGLQ